MSEAYFPVLECKSCSRTCSFMTNADFVRQTLFAWADKRPLPECAEFKEKYWKGGELTVCR